MSKWRSFLQSKEFDSPDKPGSGEKMDDELIKKLVLIRLFMKEPMIINSGYRTKKHNKKVKGASDSEHLTGEAADIRCLDSAYRLRIIQTALIVGINRIGIGKNFVHLGGGKNKLPDVMWVY